MCEDDDEEDHDVEAPCQHPVCPGKCLQGVFVEEGKEWFSGKWQNGLKDGQEGKCFTDLVGLHQFGHIRAGGGGDRVPQHKQDVAQVQNPHLSEQGRDEHANNCAEHSDHEDGGVPPLEDAAHEGNQKNLETCVGVTLLSSPRLDWARPGAHLTDQHEDGVEGAQVAVARVVQLELHPVEQVVHSTRPAVDSLAEDEDRSEADDEDSLAVFSLLEDRSNPSNRHLAHSI